MEWHPRDVDTLQAHYEWQAEQAEDARIDANLAAKRQETLEGMGRGGIG